MKKLTVIITVLISITQFFYFPRIVYAQETPTEYLRVITEDTPFYRNTTDTQPLFYLPYTYYVKSLGVVDEFTHVEVYGGDGKVALDGFVPTVFLFQDGQEVLSPYLHLTIFTSQTAVLYQDFDLSTPAQYVFQDRELTYYGFITTEQGKVFFVSYNNRLGYVKETEVYPFAVKNHPNKLTFLTTDLPNNTLTAPSTVHRDFFSLKTAIIACLLFAGLIALFIALKPKLPPINNADYYDENDYE